MKYLDRLIDRLVDWIEIRMFKKTQLRLKLVNANSRYDRVALIVGHTMKAQGAVSYNGISERIYNERVAKAVVQLVKSKKVKVFYRDGIGRNGVAKKAAKWAGHNSISIELHFNAFSGNAYGTETLYLTNDSRAREVAITATNKISKTFGTRVRSGLGCKAVSPNDRGGMNLVFCKDAGIETSILLEPFFGNNKTHESEKFLEGDGWKLYAECLADFIDSI